MNLRYKKIKSLKESSGKHNKQPIEDDNCLNEALYGMNQIEQFVKMADAIGLKTMNDFKDFMDREGQDKDVLTALYDYLHNEIGDLEFHAKDESLKEDYLENIKDPVYWQHQVDYQLEHFGRVGGGLIQDLDEAGFYLDADNKVVKKLHEDTIKDPKIKWTFIKSKEVEDSDGFLTDYTWYEGSDGTQVMVFGDNDIYKPEDGYFDITFTDRKQAEDWFNSY